MSSVLNSMVNIANGYENGIHLILNVNESLTNLEYRDVLLEHYTLYLKCGR